MTARIRFTTTTSALWRVSRVDALPPLRQGYARDVGRLRQDRLSALLRIRYRSQCGDAKDRAHLAIAKIEKRLITRRGRFYKPKAIANGARSIASMTATIVTMPCSMPRLYELSRDFGSGKTQSRLGCRVRL